MLMPVACADSNEIMAGSFLEPKGPIAINEVMPSNGSVAMVASTYSFEDWIELKNVSSGFVDLADWYISDREDNLHKFQLPHKTLSPGELFVIYCDGNASANDGVYHASFSISSDGEGILISDSDENIIDYVYVCGVPVEGSCGRMRRATGWYYFENPSPRRENVDWKHNVCQPPRIDVKGGVFNDAKELTVEMSCDSGTIYYSTDGNVPGNNAKMYTGPITLSGTTILQAVVRADDSCESIPVSESYFIGENLHLPVIAFNADDYSGFMSGIYYNPNKIYQIESQGSLALYDDGEVFNVRCGARSKGFSTITVDFKKSLGFYFRKKYGDGPIKGVDLFGNGFDKYSSLIIRSGQDQHYANVRNELLQELCLDFTDKVPTQNNRYAVFFANGHYMGVWSIKENMNEHYYASLKNVDADSVEVYHRISEQVQPTDALYDTVSFCLNNDMTVEKNYERFSQMFDIENFIDFLVIYCYSGNTDTLNNIRLFRSSEEDGKWRFAFYDMDGAIKDDYRAVRNIFEYCGKPHLQISQMALKLVENSEFRARFLSRYAEAVSGVLSDAHAVSVLDRLVSEIAPDMERDRVKFQLSYSNWEECVNILRNLISDGYAQKTVDTLCSLLNVTQEEKELYGLDRIS